MKVECPECGAPIVDRFFCECGLNQGAVAASLTGGEVEREALESLKAALETDGKAKVQENEQRRKEISGLLGRKLEASTSSIGWLRAFHAYWFGAYKQKAAEKKKPVGELDDRPKRRLSLTDITYLGLLLLILAVLWPIVVIVLVIAVVGFGICFLCMAYQYVKWLSMNLARSREERAALALEVRELDAQIEPLRARYAAEQERIRLLKEQFDKLSEALKAKEPRQKVPDSPPIGVPAPTTGLLPGFEMMAEEPPPVEEPRTEKPRGVLGLIRAAADILPVRKCPKCRASFATESDGEEVLDTRGWLSGGRPEGDLYEREPVIEKILTIAKKSKCGKCGHRWREVCDVGKTVRGACPTCYEETAILQEAEEVVGTDYTVYGAGPNRDFFHGRTSVGVRVDYLKSLRCIKCAHRWRQRAVRHRKLEGVCPVCYQDRKIPTTRDKVGSRDLDDIIALYDVHTDLRGNPIGQTVRKEPICVREDVFDTTYQCRSCSHEWKERSSESYRVF